MKKKFDAVAIMREAREKLAREWEDKPREKEIASLRQKFSSLARKKRASR